VLPIMTTFDAYSKYYDLFYREKDYVGEVDYVEARFTALSRAPVKSILDVGCGSGRHALLFGQRGYLVQGIDRSKTMLALAQQRKGELAVENVTFHCQDATDIARGRRFDVVTALFHVINYQAGDRALDAMLACVGRHLEPGGLFIFDFWYGPAVLHQRPETRVKRLEDETANIIRIAEPRMDVKRNTVDVNYEVIVTDKGSGHVQVLNERHCMRYLFYPEIEQLLAENGFAVDAASQWMAPDRPLGEDTWSGEVVARRL
jgi:SAM-dependent methyltransferase